MAVLSARSRRAAAWVGVALLVATIVAIIGPGSTQDEAERAGDDSARLLLESLVSARHAYWLNQAAGGTTDPNRTPIVRRSELKPVRDACSQSRTGEACRRYAVIAYSLGLPDWRSALLSMRTRRIGRTLNEVDRELAGWAIVFGADKPRSDEVPALERSIRRMHLGWFEHLALAALYDNHGKPSQASAMRRAALWSTLRLSIVALLMLAACVAGLALLAVAVIVALAERGHRTWSRMRPPTPLPKDASRFLFVTAASYFGAVVLVRLALPPQLVDWLRSLEGATGNAARTAASLAIGVAVVVPALVGVAYLGRRAGVGLATVGIARPRIMRDALVGIVGYCAATPLLVGSLLLSSLLFDESGSRINPAVTEFATAGSLMSRALLLCIAVVVAPLSEEFIFRGVLFRAIQPYVGTIGSMLLTSGLFAIVHPQLPLGFLSICVLGMLFSVLYVWRGSLWPAVVAHGLNNAVVFIQLSLILGN